MTKEDLDLLKELKSNMNNKRSWEERWRFSKNNSSPDNLTDAWIAGFIEGDGSFEYYFSKFRPLIQISQNSHDRPLLESIRQYLGLGYLKPKGESESLSMEATKGLRLSKNDFRIGGNKAMTKIMFPLLDKFNLYSQKGEKYKILKQLVDIHKKEKKGEIRHQQMSVSLRDYYKRNIQLLK